MTRSLRSRPTGSPLVEYVPPRRVRKAPRKAPAKASAATSPDASAAPAEAQNEASAPAAAESTQPNSPEHSPPPAEAVTHTPIDSPATIIQQEPEDDVPPYTPTPAVRHTSQTRQSQPQLQTITESPAPQLRHSPSFTRSVLGSVSPKLIDAIKYGVYGQGEKRDFERMKLSDPDAVAAGEERPAKRSRANDNESDVSTPTSRQDASDNNHTSPIQLIGSSHIEPATYSTSPSTIQNNNHTPNARALPSTDRSVGNPSANKSDSTLQTTEPPNTLDITPNEHTPSTHQGYGGQNNRGKTPTTLQRAISRRYDRERRLQSIRTSASGPSTKSSITPLNTLIFPATSTKQEFTLTDPDAIDKLRAIAEWFVREPDHKFPDTAEIVAFLDNSKSQILPKSPQNEQFSDIHQPLENEHVSETELEHQFATTSDSGDDIIMPEVEEEDEVSVINTQTTPPIAQESSRWSTFGALKSIVSTPLKFFGSRKKSAMEQSPTTNEPKTEFSYRHERQLVLPSETSTPTPAMSLPREHKTRDTAIPTTPSIPPRRSFGNKRQAVSERRPVMAPAVLPPRGICPPGYTEVYSRQKRGRFDPRKRAASSAGTEKGIPDSGSMASTPSSHQHKLPPKLPIAARGLITEERKKELQKLQQEEEDREKELRQEEERLKLEKKAAKEEPKFYGYRCYTEEPDFDQEEFDREVAEAEAAEAQAKAAAAATASLAHIRASHEASSSASSTSPEGNDAVSGGGQKKRKRVEKPMSDERRKRGCKRRKILPQWAIDQGFTVDTFNWSGWWPAPDPEDSDSEDSDSDEETEIQTTTDSSAAGTPVQPAQEVPAEVQRQPPPKPRPSNAVLPAQPAPQPVVQPTTAQVAKITRYVPKTPSRLRNMVPMSSPLEKTPETEKENVSPWSLMDVDTPSILGSVEVKHSYNIPTDFKIQYVANPRVLADVDQAFKQRNELGVSVE